jgi:hypothetical protein
MSTLESSHRRAHRPRSRVAGVLIATGTLVAVAIAAVFIFAFAGRSTTGSPRPATVAAHAPYAPLIQYRGTGQPPTTVATLGAPPTVGLLRAEHSYGAVP